MRLCFLGVSGLSGFSSDAAALVRDKFLSSGPAALETAQPAEFKGSRILVVGLGLNNINIGSLAGNAIVDKLSQRKRIKGESSS